MQQQRGARAAALAFSVRVSLLSFIACAVAEEPQRVDFFELEKQRVAQGLRLTHYDYPSYGEAECKTLIDDQAWAPGGQIPFSCLMDRLKRLYLIAQDIWSLGSEASMKQTALADDPTPLIAGLQTEEGAEATGGATQLEDALRAAGRASQARLLEETAAFLQMESQAQPVAPINIPQIQKLMRGLLFILREANEMVDKVKSGNGVTGAP